MCIVHYSAPHRQSTLLWQVEMIEKMVMDIIEEEFHFRPCGFCRCSDKCSGQFFVSCLLCMNLV